MNNLSNEIDVNKMSRDITGWYIHEEFVKITFMCWEEPMYGLYCELYSDQTGETIARFKQKQWKIGRE